MKNLPKNLSIYQSGSSDFVVPENCMERLRDYVRNSSAKRKCYPPFEISKLAAGPELDFYLARTACQTLVRSLEISKNN